MGQTNIATALRQFLLTPWKKKILIKHNYLFGSAMRTVANEAGSSVWYHEDSSSFLPWRWTMQGSDALWPTRECKMKHLASSNLASTNPFPQIQCPVPCPVKKWVTFLVSGPGIDVQGWGRLKGKARVTGSKASQELKMKVNLHPYRWGTRFPFPGSLLLWILSPLQSFREKSKTSQVSNAQ